MLLILRNQLINFIISMIIIIVRIIIKRMIKKGEKMTSLDVMFEFTLIIDDLFFLFHFEWFSIPSHLHLSSRFSHYLLSLIQRFLLKRSIHHLHLHSKGHSIRTVPM